MKRRAYALALGLLACGGATKTTTDDAGTSPTASVPPPLPPPATTVIPAVPPPAVDAGDGGQQGDASSGVGICPSTDPISGADLPWAPPAALQSGACTAMNVTSMQQFLQSNPSATNDQFEQYIQSLGAACHDCVYTDANAATWGPIPKSGGKLVTLNIGACFAIRSGNVPCGKAIQNEFDCEFVACADCADATAFDTCRHASQLGACKPFVQGIQTACAGVSSSVDNVCGTFFQSITAQCVGP